MKPEAAASSCWSSPGSTRRGSPPSPSARRSAPPSASIRRASWCASSAGAEAGSDALLAEVQLGVADAARGIAAKRPDRETIYWLPFERGEQIPTSPEALRERFLAPPPGAGAAAPAGAAEAGGEAAEPPAAGEAAAPE